MILKPTRSQNHRNLVPHPRERNETGGHEAPAVHPSIVITIITVPLGNIRRVLTNTKNQSEPILTRDQHRGADQEQNLDPDLEQGLGQDLDQGQGRVEDPGRDRGIDTEAEAIPHDEKQNLTPGRKLTKQSYWKSPGKTP